MKPFTYHRYDPAASDDRGTWLAGGTDLLPSMKLGLVTPDHVVDLKTAPLGSTIETTDDGWRLGALATLTDIERHPGLRDGATALTEAVAQAATRQIRNRATIGGNLLQRSRCSYYRDPDVSCWLDGGKGCPARDGRHATHAVVDTGPCITTHPSDAAAALTALDATVLIDRDGEPIEEPIDSLLRPPVDSHRSLHTLGDGDIVRAIHVPRAEQRRSTYLKAMDRAAWQFAIVGVALVRSPDRVSLVASGVAATPWRLAEAERVLGDHGDVDRPIPDDLVDAAVRAAVDGLDPLPDNAYKLPLIQGLVRRALERTGAAGAPADS